MQPTPYLAVFGVIVFMIIISRDRVKAAWFSFAVLQAFGATSVANLPALGGASIILPQVGMVILLYAAFVMVAYRDPESMRSSMIVHTVGLLLIVYTAAIGFLGPRIFANTVDLLGMRPDMELHADGFKYAVATPLAPRSSNITQTAYLCGSFLTAFATSIVFARRLTAKDFRNAMIAVGLLHAALGLADFITGLLHISRALDFLKNAGYAMLDQSIAGIKRLSGSLPEPSAYAGFGVPFAVFCMEEWFRSKSKLAGRAGLLIWLLVLASTSSTGMFAFAVYTAVAIPRFLLMQHRFRAQVAFIVVVLGAVLLFAGISLANPAFFTGISDFVLDLTIRKGDSQSGIERGSWSAQGWLAFQASHGLGVGAGSFRSSSLAASAIGSIGVVGSSLMVIFALQVVWATLVRKESSTRQSAGWAALYALAPPLVSATTPDPGFLFAMFAGYALAPSLPGAATEPSVEDEQRARGLQLGILRKQSY